MRDTQLVAGGPPNALFADSRRRGRAWQLAPLILLVLVFAHGAPASASVGPLPRLHAVTALSGNQLLLRTLTIRGIAGRKIDVTCNHCLRSNVIPHTVATADERVYQNEDWYLSAGRVVRIVLFKPGRIGRYVLLYASVSANPKLYYKSSGCVRPLRNTGQTVHIVRCPSGTTQLRSGTLVPQVPVTDTVLVTLTGTGEGTVNPSTSGFNSPSRTCATVGPTTACSLQYVDGSNVTLTPTPSPGSAFSGWSGACTGTGVCTLAVHASVSATATFSLITHGVTYSTAGTGTGTISDAGAGLVAGSRTCTGTAPTTCKVTYAAGSTATLTATPAPSSVFSGWSGACSGLGTCTLQVSGDASATGTFTLATHKVSFTVAGMGAGTVAPSTQGQVAGTYMCTKDAPQVCSAQYVQASTVSLTASADKGSVFSGWTGDCSGTGGCTLAVGSDMSVTATFTLVPHTLTITIDGPGGWTGSAGYIPGTEVCMSADVCTLQYTDSTVVTIIPQAAANATFIGWSGACSGTGACVVTMTADMSVTATFAANYTLTLNRVDTAGGGGEATLSPDGYVPQSQNCNDQTGSCTFQYVAGSEVTIVPSANPGSTFAGWSGACTGTDSCVVDMTGDMSVTATFTVAHTLTLSQSGTGAGSVQPSADGYIEGTDDCATSFPTCSLEYVSGTVATLVATPQAGSQFSGWSGACAGVAGNACSVPMTADRSVNAIFTAS